MKYFIFILLLIFLSEFPLKIYSQKNINSLYQTTNLQVQDNKKSQSSLIKNILTKNPLSMVGNHLFSQLWEVFEQVTHDMNQFIYQRDHRSLNPYGSLYDFSDYKENKIHGEEYRRDPIHSESNTAIIGSDGKRYVFKRMKMEGVDPRFAPLQLTLESDEEDKLDEDEIIVDPIQDTTISILNQQNEQYEQNAPPNAGCGRSGSGGNIFVGRYLKYPTTVYYCNSVKVSKEVYDEQKDTNLQCYEVLEEISACFCAQDRAFSTSTNTCSTNKPFTCKITITSPTKDCKKPDGIRDDETELGGKPIFSAGESCWTFKSMDYVEFTFNVNCSSNLTPETVDAARLPKNVTFTDIDTHETLTWEEAMSSFSYFSKFGTPTDGVYPFALTSSFGGPIHALPWNLLDLPNRNFLRVFTLNNANMWVGNVPFTFPVNLSAIPKSFYTGNRLYLEIRFNTSRVPNSVAQFFIDISDLSEPSNLNVTNLVLVIVLPIVSVVVATVLGIILIYQLIKWRKNRKFFKSD